MTVAFVTVALIGVLSVIYIQPLGKDQVFNAPLLTSLEIRNPEIALKYGIVGYVEIMAPDASKSLSLSKGSETSITILLHFVSHVSEVTETRVKIDPNSGEGLTIEQVYAIEDGDGNIIGRGIINVNELISYNPSGLVTLKAGQPLPVTLTICIPIDFPRDVDPFPLGAVGITASVPILSDIKVMVYA